MLAWYAFQEVRQEIHGSVLYCPHRALYRVLFVNYCDAHHRHPSLFLVLGRRHFPGAKRLPRSGRALQRQRHSLGGIGNDGDVVKFCGEEREWL